MDQSKTNIPQVQKVSKSVQNLKQLRTHITGNIDKGMHALKVDPVSFNFKSFEYVCLVLKYDLLIGALVHTRCDGGKKAYAFVDLHQFAHDSNLTITVLLNVLQDTNARAQVLYLQLDNCYRENKNRYILALCALFVEARIFRKVNI